MGNEVVRINEKCLIGHSLSVLEMSLFDPFEDVSQGCGLDLETWTGFRLKPQKQGFKP